MIVQGNIKNTSINIYGYAEPEVTTAQRAYTYAPGIATYGIRGVQGQTGLNGNSFFYTDLIMDTEYSELIDRITSNKSIIGYKDFTYKRPYQNGDIIIDKYGDIYIITNINQLIIDNRNGSITDISDIDNYFNKLGNITIDNNIPFEHLNTRTQKTVITDTSITNTNEDSLLTLVSKPDNNITNFIDMNAIYNGIPDVNLSIYYDANSNGFHIDSSYPIYIDAPFSVAYNSNVYKSDIYSPVQTTSNSITTYVSICKDINVSIDSSIFPYTKNDSSIQYYGCVYTLTFSNNIKELISNVDTTFENLKIHFQNGSYSDFQPLRKDQNVYRFVQQYDYVKFNDAAYNVEYKELQYIQVSLIYNIEVFLHITKAEMKNAILIDNE